jgi:hypothetical protein
MSLSARTVRKRKRNLDPAFSLTEPAPSPASSSSTLPSEYNDYSDEHDCVTTPSNNASDHNELPASILSDQGLQTFLSSFGGGGGVSQLLDPDSLIVDDDSEGDDNDTPEWRLLSLLCTLCSSFSIFRAFNFLSSSFYFSNDHSPLDKVDPFLPRDFYEGGGPQGEEGEDDL